MNVSRRLRALASIVALSTLALTLSPSGPASAASTQPLFASATCSPGVPSYDCGAATFVYNYVVSHPFNPPGGYTGGRVYRNDSGLLPAGGNYHEYDIYPPNAGGRTAERLVIDWYNPQGNSWYSPDHYANFVQFYLLA